MIEVLKFIKKDKVHDQQSIKVGFLINAIESFDLFLIMHLMINILVITN